VEYREKDATVDRTARSARLDAALKPAFASIDSATFTGNARFNDATISGTAASIRYGLDAGVLELTGTEPASPVPHVNNDQIDVNATRIDVKLAGPVLKASTNVKSVLLPPKRKSPGKDSKDETHLPSMLKQDQPVTVTGQTLDYDGAASKATYTGGAQLWQIDTSIKGDTIILDDKTGDMSASGSVTTTAMLEQENKEKKKERVRSIGTSKDFKYEDAINRATYTGDAHLAGTQSDITAQKIELYLKPGGQELDHAEAYEQVTLREQHRKTTGGHLTYTAADETYVVTGVPVIIVDECGRETTGATLTFVKGTDTIVMDGNERGRTRTKGGDKCQ
jgi:lipopolysaccharide export system protein LptA